MRAPRVLFPAVFVVVLLGIVSAPTLSAFSIGEVGESVPTSNHQPNIILFLTDDQRQDSLGLMPAVQDLQAQGVTFQNSFVTTPLCCPSRASLLTGQYAHNHGIFKNFADEGGGFPNFDDDETLAVWLDEAGYETALIGKYLNDYDAASLVIPQGWDHWVGQDDNGQYGYELNVNGVLETHGSSEEDYSPHVLTDYALDFLEATEGPFFMVFSITVPHAPADPPPGSTCVWTNVWERRDCSLEAADAALAELMTAAPADTIFVYTSDNGFIDHEHGRNRGKNCPYDECLRVPLVLRYPGVVPGSISTKFALNLDLTATIVSWASAIPGHTLNGQSLITATREQFMFEMEQEGAVQGRIEGARWRKWKYIVWPNGAEELFNMQRDPGELKNIASRARQQDVLADMRQRLEELRQE